MAKETITHELGHASLVGSSYQLQGSHDYTIMDIGVDRSLDTLLDKDLDTLLDNSLDMSLTNIKNKSMGDNPQH